MTDSEMSDAEQTIRVYQQMIAALHDPRDETNAWDEGLRRVLADALGDSVPDTQLADAASAAKAWTAATIIALQDDHRDALVRVQDIIRRAQREGNTVVSVRELLAAISDRKEP